MLCMRSPRAKGPRRIKDNKFGRDEAVGIRTLIDGIALTTADDRELIARGTEVLSNLYEEFGKKRQ